MDIAGWQAGCLDRGEALDSALTKLARLQTDRVDDWRDEEPGRIPYQVRTGPLARLDVNPYAAYYADYASPLMFVISLANLYAWTGDRRRLEKHWDAARRILDWARGYGDADRDEYLEYRTRSTKGAKNQGLKDSGDAIVYDDGSAVPPPIATCELQGYWYAAQELMSLLSCHARGDRPVPGAYPRSNTPRLLNATAFPLIVQTLLGLVPLAPAETLVLDPALPAWIPELVLHDLRVGQAKVTLRFRVDDRGTTKWDVLHKQGTLQIVRQPPPESLSARWTDRTAGLIETILK
ncbi:MAG: hypothetical protein ACRD15_14645 [Vicinamibacterales bacterium]